MENLDPPPQKKAGDLCGVNKHPDRPPKPAYCFEIHTFEESHGECHSELQWRQVTVILGSLFGPSIVEFRLFAVCYFVPYKERSEQDD